MASVAKVAKTELSENDSALLEIIESIDEVQKELDDISDKVTEDIVVVRHKYDLLRKPHFDQRKKLIAKIPHFWSKAFANHPQLSSRLTEKDAEIMTYLQSIDVEVQEILSEGYRISFTFANNPIFKNTVLEKTFNKSDRVIVTASKIEWIKEEGDTKSCDDASFFEWFEEEPESFDEVGLLIKEELWRNPISFYLGKAIDCLEDSLDDDDDSEESE